MSKVNQKAVVSANVTTKEEVSLPADGKTYVVQPGDTLWDISQKFKGISVEKIKTLNKLKSNRLEPGMKLIVG